jgi:homoserine O-acetyltransferase
MHLKSYCFLLFILVLTHLATAQQRFFNLGDFKLENGQVIKNCRLGYRTVGTLNPNHSNAVLVPTWFTGTSQQKLSMAAPGQVADSTRFFTIVVDALGNGVSSSPSNSKAQPNGQFPTFSIRDMVRAEHELVTRHLGLPHLYAVAGISMGGMQSLEWLFSYPGLMNKVVSIVGTPNQSAYDRFLWGTQLAVLERGKYSTDAMKTVGALHEMHLTSPSYYYAKLPTEQEFRQHVQAKEAEYVKNNNPYNWASQLRAMLGHDVFRGRDREEALRSTQAKVLVVVALQDHMVNPLSAIQLARDLNAELLELTGNCGHLANGCETDKIREKAKTFMALQAE